MVSKQGWIVLDKKGEEEGIDLQPHDGSQNLRAPSKYLLALKKEKDIQSKSHKEVIDHLKYVVSQTQIPAQDEFYGKLAALDEKIQALSETKIMVIGDAQVGKSSLINCLLGKKMVPSTESIGFPLTYLLKYSDDLVDTMYYVYLSQISESFLSVAKIPVWIQNHLRDNSWNVPIIFQSMESLIETFSGGNLLSSHEYLDLMKSMIERIEILSSHPILSTGLIIIDCPDINNRDEISRAMMNYVPQANLVIYMTTPQSLSNEKELLFVDKMQNFFGVKDLFFVCGKFETAKSATETLTLACETYSSRSPIGPDGIQFVSFLHALEDFYCKPHVPTESEGLIIAARKRILAFDESIFRYLKCQLFSTSISLYYEEIVLASKCKEEVEQLKQLANKDPSQIQATIQELTPRLTMLQIEGDQVIQQFKQDVSSELVRIQQDSQEFLLSLIRDIPSIVSNSKPKTGMTLLSAFSDFSWKIYCCEVCDLVRDELGNRLGLWIRDTLRPSVECFVRQFEQKIGQKIGAKLLEIDNMRVRIRQGTMYIPFLTEDYESSTITERLWSTTGLAKDIAGFVGLYQSLYPYFGTSLIAQVATYSTVLLSTTLTMSSVISTLIGKSEGTETYIKEKISQSMVSSMKSHTPQASIDISSTFKEFLLDVVKRVETGLRFETEQLTRSLKRAQEMQTLDLEELRIKKDGLQLQCASIFHFVMSIQDSVNEVRKKQNGK